MPDTFEITKRLKRYRAYNLHLTFLKACLTWDFQGQILVYNHSKINTRALLLWKTDTR